MGNNKMQTYSPKDVKATWGSTKHEATCATETYDVPANIVVPKEDFPEYDKVTPCGFADCTGYYKDDVLVGTFGWRSGEHKVPNPEYKEPVCDCNPTVTPVDLLAGCADDTFITITPKGDK